MIKYRKTIIYKNEIRGIRSIKKTKGVKKLENYVKNNKSRIFNFESKNLDEYKNYYQISFSDMNSKICAICGNFVENIRKISSKKFECQCMNFLILKKLKSKVELGLNDKIHKMQEKIILEAVYISLIKPMRKKINNDACTTKLICDNFIMNNPLFYEGKIKKMNIEHGPNPRVLIIIGEKIKHFYLNLEVLYENNKSDNYNCEYV